MEVSQKSKDRLVMQSAAADIFKVYYLPFGLCAVPALILLKNGHWGLFVFFMVGSPLIILTIVGRVATKKELWLDRQRGVVEIKEGQLFPSTTLQRPLSELKRVIVQDELTKRSDGSPGLTAHRAAMEFVSGLNKEEVPIRDVFGDQKNAHELAGTINTWLAQDVDSAQPHA